MAEKLGEVGKILSGLGDAVKTMKTIRQNSAELYKVTEETKKYALEVQNIYLPGDSKLNELKKILSDLLCSASNLESELKNFGSEIGEFDQYMREKIKGASIPREVTEEFCVKLKKMHSMSQSFSNTFGTFVHNLGRAQQLATELEVQEREKAEAMKKEADSKQNWGAAGSTLVIAAGVGIFALGFFTGGAAWVAGAAMAGGVAAAGAGAALAIKTVVDVKAMRELASGIVSGVNKLGVLATKLKSSSDQAGKIKLDKEAVEALETALDLFRKDLNQEEMIKQQKMDLRDKDEKIAELERKLQSLGH